jgi:hypothetical protein
MRGSRKAALVAACLGAVAVAGALFFFSGFRRSEVTSASPAPELLSELPAGAPTLVFIDLAAVRASSFYQHRPDKEPIAVPDRDYADFVRATGFNFEKDLDRVVLATWPAAPGEKQRKTIIIAEGRFDRAKIRDYAMRKGKLNRQQGHDVFLFPTKIPGQWNAITFLDDHRLALVQGESIAPLFSAHADPATADPARQRATRLDGAVMFAITRVPPVPDNFGAGGVQAAQLANLVRSVQWVTLAARPEGDDVRVSLEGECSSATNARELQAALEVLRMIGRAGLASPKTRRSMDASTYAVLQTLLQTADVTATGERVRILVELTPDILKLKLTPPNSPRQTGRNH